MYIYLNGTENELNLMYIYVISIQKNTSVARKGLILIAEIKILKGNYIVKKMASKKIYSLPILGKIDEIENWLRELEIR